MSYFQSLGQIPSKDEVSAMNGTSSKPLIELFPAIIEAA
jgi:hypothetical protein